MDSLLIGLVSALIATNQPAAVSNLVYEKTGKQVEIANSNDPVEQEFQAVMIQDDDAQTEVDKWIQDNNKFAQSGAGVPKAELNQRIRARFDTVRKAYEAFLVKHPDHARARVAYASFLDDTGDEDGSGVQLEKARELDPKNPAVWNNLANYYGHAGEVTNAFICYAKAIELNPTEPLYYQNYGTTVFLFRKDAEAHFNFTEQQVFDKALELYRQAMKLAPGDFALATDVAQTYYGIRPWRFNDAMQSWTNALNIAHNEVEREGVYIHMARIETQEGFFEQAARHIDAVTNSTYTDLKQRVATSLASHRADAAQIKTNTPPAPAKTP